jgi:hypothetical protein
VLSSFSGLNFGWIYVAGLMPAKKQKIFEIRPNIGAESMLVLLSLNRNIQNDCSGMSSRIF